MAQATDTVWLPVLPSMKGFGPALISGAGREADKGGKRIGGRFGTAIVAGVAAVGAGAAAAGAALYSVGSTFESMTNSIQVSTGATGAELDGLVDSAKNVGLQVPVEFDQIGDALANLNTYTGASGETLEELTGQVLDASRILGEDGVANSEAFGQAMQQWQIPAEEGAPMMDTLFKATQEYGMGLDTTIGHLNTYGSVLNNAGFSMEESAALFGQLESSGLSVSRVMPGLNSAFRGWASEGKDVQEELGNVVGRMQEAETEQEALAIATDEFGAEGAQRLTTAIRSGSLELDDLSSALSGAEGLIGDTSEATMTWQDQWQRFKNTVMVWLEPLATHLMAQLASGMELATDAVQAFAQGFQGIGSDADGLVGFFGSLGEHARTVTDYLLDSVVPAFQSLAEWISTNRVNIGFLLSIVAGAVAPFLAYRAAIAGISAVMRAWTVVTTALTAAKTALNVVLRANPIGIIITLISALVGGIVYLATQTDFFGDLWGTVWSWIRSAASAVVGWFMETAVPFLTTMWDGIAIAALWLRDTIWTPVWSAIRAAARVVVDWFMHTALPFLSNAFALIGRALTWLYEEIWQPTWEVIKIAAQLVSDYFTKILIPIYRHVFDMIGKYLTWLYEEVWTPVWDWIKRAAQLVVTYFTEVVVPTYRLIFDLIGNYLTWLYEDVWLPVWDVIQRVVGRVAGWIMGTAVPRISDAFTLIGRYLTWLYEDIWQPVWDLVQRAVDVVANWIMGTAVPFLSNAFDVIGQQLTWLYEDIWLPVWNLIQDTVDAVADFIMNTAVPWITDAWDAMGVAVRVLYEQYVEPALDAISIAWNWLKDTISSVWEDNIQPVFQAFGDFIMNDVVGMVEDGVDLIDSAWRKIANFFRAPMNWVIDTVWNSGIAGAFNEVASTLNLDVSMGEIPEIPAFAQGGYHGGGWAVVGEEGPELAYFGSDARILTNDQTQQAFTDGVAQQGEDVPMGTHASTNIGDGGGGWVSSAWNWVNDNTPVGDVVDWARGGLADAAETFIKPIVNKVTDFVSDWGFMGELGGSMADSTFDALIDWVRGEDSPPPSAGGIDAGSYEGNPGGFSRPSTGPVTSWYGYRNFQGAFGNFHAGVDLAAGLGAPVFAAYDGRIVRDGYWQGGNTGHSILMDHGNGLQTVYMHLQNSIKSVGDEVVSGTPIAREGGSGGVAPHLHYEEHPTGWFNPANINSRFRDRGGLVPPGDSMVRNLTGGYEYIQNEGQFRRTQEAIATVAAISDPESVGGGNEYNFYGVEADDPRKLRNEFDQLTRSKHRKVGV